jgi:hypothetical protein
VLPSVHPELGLTNMFDYSWFIVIVALGAAIGFVFLSFIEKAFIKRLSN